MGNLLAATTFRRYAVRLGTGTEATGYPASNIRLLLQPARSWRTTAVGAQSLILDLGSPDVPLAYLLYGANFPFVSVGLSSSPTFASDQNPRFTAAAVPFFDRTNRRRVWLHDPTNTLSKRYVRVTAIGAADGGVPYFELEACAVLTNFMDLGIGAKAIRTRKMQAIGRVDFKDGGADRRRHGRSHLEVEIERDEWVKAEQDNLWTIYDASPARPIALFENGNDPSRFYLGRRVGDPEVSESLVIGQFPLVIQEAA